MSTLFSQIPAGAVLDAIRDQRPAVLPGMTGVGLAALLLCLTAARAAVYAALTMQGPASSLIAPGITAISMPLVGQAGLSERIGRNARFTSIGNGFATLVVAATTLVPQAIVAAISPRIGRQAEISGRRPLLGWRLVPVPGLLYAALPRPFALVPGNLLNAVSAATFGVLMTVVAADLTRCTCCFNLTLGALGVAISAGASLDTLFSGISAAVFGARTAALGLALVGLCGLLLLWGGMPETRRQRMTPHRVGPSAGRNTLGCSYHPVRGGRPPDRRRPNLCGPSRSSTQPLYTTRIA